MQIAEERASSAHSNAFWMAKTKAMREDMEAAQSIATKLDSMYKLSEEECLRLRAQFK